MIESLWSWLGISYGVYSSSQAHVQVESRSCEADPLTYLAQLVTNTPSVILVIRIYKSQSKALNATSLSSFTIFIAFPEKASALRTIRDETLSSEYLI